MLSTAPYRLILEATVSQNWEYIQIVNAEKNQWNVIIINTHHHPTPIKGETRICWIGRYCIHGPHNICRVGGSNDYHSTRSPTGGSCCWCYQEKEIPSETQSPIISKHWEHWVSWLICGWWWGCNMGWRVNEIYRANIVVSKKWNKPPLIVVIG